MDDPRNIIIEVLATQIQKYKEEISLLQSQLQQAYEQPQAPPLPVEPQPPETLLIEEKTQDISAIKTPVSAKKYENALWVWVGNIKASKSNKDIMWDMFDRYGRVNDVYFHHTKNYAIVRMSSPEQAKRAMTHLDGVTISSTRIRVKPFRPKSF